MAVRDSVQRAADHGRGVEGRLEVLSRAVVRQRRTQYLERHDQHHQDVFTFAIQMFFGKPPGGWHWEINQVTFVGTNAGFGALYISDYGDGTSFEVLERYVDLVFIDVPDAQSRVQGQGLNIHVSSGRSLMAQITPDHFPADYYGMIRGKAIRGDTS